MKLIVIALLALAVARSPAFAQEPLSRADSADVLVGTAERLHAQGSTEVAEALARLVQSRYGDTPAAARASALLASAGERRASRSGRVGVIAFTTIYGAWLGAAVPAMFNADEPAIYGLGLLTGAPLGFFGGRAYTRNRSVTGGDAGVIAWSGLWGTYQGIGWQEALELFDDCEQVADDLIVCESSGTDTFAPMVLGGLVGIGTAAVAADVYDIGGGTATMIAWGSLWGTGAGLVLSVLADMGGDDEPLLAALIGGDLGLLAAALLAPDWDMSTGRAWLVNAAGVMGGAIGGGVDLLIQPDNTDIAILIPTVGAAVGLGLGAHLTREHDEGRIREGRLGPVDDSGALVRLRDGDWRVALPHPSPALLREHARDDGELGVHVPLLDARF